MLDFNDDSPTTELQNPTHNFYVEGNYTVSCVSSNGLCSDTAYINIIIGAPLGINEKDKSLTISPNPSNDFVKVNSPEMIDYIRVFDMEGREIMNQIGIHSDKTQFNVSSWKSGIYILELSTNNLIKRKKFVVNN